MIACAGVMLLLWLAFALNTRAPVFPYDDSYIALHSAQFLGLGYDPSFPTGHPLDGCTSIAHIAFIAVMLKVFSPLWALMATLWLAALAYALGLAKLAFVHGAKWFEAAGVVLVGLTTGLVTHHLLNGLETGLMLAGLVWALVFATDVRLRETPWAPLIWSQLPFLRPELALVSMLLLGIRIWRRIRNGSPPRTLLMKSLGDILIMTLAAAPWVLWYWHNTGIPVPSSVLAKRNFFAEVCLPIRDRLGLIRFGLSRFASPIGVLKFSLLGLLLTSTGRVGLVLAAAMVAAYCRYLPSGFVQYDGRYLYVLVPFLMYGLLIALTHANRLLRWAGVALLAACIGQSLWAFHDRWMYHRAEMGFVVSQSATVAQWCNTHLPPGSSLLIHDAGYISFATAFQLWDLVGLKTPMLAAFHRADTFPTCGDARGQALNRIALAVHPNYLVVMKFWDRTFNITSALKAGGWKLDLLREGFNPGDAIITYNVYKMTPPDRK